MKQKKLPLKDNCTQNDCLQILEKSQLDGEFKELYKNVNHSWISLAYAHCDVPMRTLEILIDTNFNYINSATKAQKGKT